MSFQRKMDTISATSAQAAEHQLHAQKTQLIVEQTFTTVLGIDYAPRLNGNMHIEQGQSQLSTMVVELLYVMELIPMQMLLGGIFKTQTVRLILWGKSRQMLGVFMTWQAMYGNGVTIGMGAMVLRQ